MNPPLAVDRRPAYYFQNMDNLVSEVLQAFGQKLQAILAEAFQDTAKTHIELLSAAWPVLSDPDQDAVFGMLLEVNGLSGAGREPYAKLAPLLLEAWIDWLANFIEGTPETRRTEAITTVALLDGLLQIRLLAGLTSPT